MVEIKRFPWSDSGGFLCVHYLDAYKPIQGEWALLQILSNVAYKNCFVYWTMPGSRFWQNCHFRHICQICQYHQLLWGPLIALCFAMLEILAKLSFLPYLPNSPVSPTFMGPLIALCFAMLAILAKLSFSPYLPNLPVSPTFMGPPHCFVLCHFCHIGQIRHFCRCVHFWTYLQYTCSNDCIRDSV